MQNRLSPFCGSTLWAGILILLSFGCATHLPFQASRSVASALPAHPLSPLSIDEIALASDTIRKHREFSKGALFPMIALKEPPKQEIKAFRPGQPFRREATATVLDRAANQAFQVTVDLRKGEVIDWKKLEGVQPLVLVEEYDKVPQLVKTDPRWQEAMRRRGITDFSQVWVDTWATGNILPDHLKAKYGARLLRGISYLQQGATNFYGRPIEGVVAIVDMNQEKVIDLIDTGIVPVAKKTQELDEAAIGPQRTDVKPLAFLQKEGPSFKIEGNEIQWQKWHFRFSMHPREALVLHDVRYEDNGKLRSILFRGSLSETLVPYGDPDSNWSWRDAFDEGEYGMGRLASPLEPVVDAPENAVFFNADFADDFGKPYTMKNAVGMYERDGGILWKHYDIYKQKNETRRARELVLYCVAAIGNYDYAFSWIFHQDGTLEVDVGLTGIMLPKGVPDQTLANHSAAAHFAHLVAPNVAAPHHQHFINFRLDFDIDGESNSVAEWNSGALGPSPGNPLLNAIHMDSRVLKTEREARRDVNFKTARKWQIFNPSVKNALGYNSSYILVPGETAYPYLSPENPVRKRGAFIDHQLWVTRYQPDELNASGYYPNQAPGGDGLEKWTANNEPIENQDLVVWYTFGVTHIPRPEEWPVMPIHHAGFQLIPAGFFSENPALDVPKSSSE